MNAIPESPQINNPGAPDKCIILNKTANTVIELNSAPEIKNTFFIISNISMLFF